jgi:hypothetical protein
MVSFKCEVDSQSATKRTSMCRQELAATSASAAFSGSTGDSEIAGAGETSCDAREQGGELKYS